MSRDQSSRSSSSQRREPVRNRTRSNSRFSFRPCRGTTGRSGPSYACAPDGRCPTTVPCRLQDERPAARAGPAGPSAEALAGADLEIEPVRRGSERTRPLRIEGARRLEREVEVEDEAVRRPPGAEVRALRRVEQVAAGAVRLATVRRIAEGEEQSAGIALHPEELEPPRSAREGDRHRAEPLEGHRAAGTHRQVDREAGEAHRAEPAEGPRALVVALRLARFRLEPL